MKNYRYACYVISKFKHYLNTTYFQKEKVFYLNKDGRNLIGSDNEITKATQIEHNLLKNEAYIHFGFPMDWQLEKGLSYKMEKQTELSKMGIKTPSPSHIEIKTQGFEIKRLVSDAYFSRNGYEHFIEIDNTRDMKDNKKKIEQYEKALKNMQKLEIFTTTNNRKEKFEKWCRESKIAANIYIYDDIKKKLD